MSFYILGQEIKKTLLLLGTMFALCVTIKCINAQLRTALVVENGVAKNINKGAFKAVVKDVAKDSGTVLERLHISCKTYIWHTYILDSVSGTQKSAKPV